MNIQRQTETMRQKLANLLKQHPGERENSLGIVVASLEEKHVAAATWLEQNRGMAMSVHNLHDLIVNYEMLESAAKATADGDVTDVLKIQPGRFNPAHLTAYFRR